MLTQSYEFYIVWMYVAVAILVCTLGVGVWINQCYKANNFPYIW